MGLDVLPFCGGTGQEAEPELRGLEPGQAEGVGPLRGEDAAEEARPVSVGGETFPVIQVCGLTGWDGGVWHGILRLQG